MKIDWFTVVAQVVNFLILVLLLKRFLYGPLTRAMAQRQEAIQEKWNQSQAAQEEAAVMLETYQKERKAWSEQREAEMTDALKQVEAQKEQWLQDARDEVMTRKQVWLQALQRERNDFVQDLRRRVGTQTIDIARHALHELADVALEQYMISMFLQKLRTLPYSEQKEWDQALEKNPRVTVSSSFPVPQTERENILQAVQRDASREVELQFVEDPDLLCGIQLQTEQLQIAWHLKAHLEALEQVFAHELWEDLDQRVTTS